MQTSRYVSALWGTLTCALALAACGDDGTASTTTETGTSSSGSTTEISTTAPTTAPTTTATGSGTGTHTGSGSGSMASMDTGLPGNLLKFARLAGFKPYIQIHTHLSNLDDLNEEGWNECYRCCADLYRVRPYLLGMYGSSWFYDPALADISPRLDYLREIPVRGGAQLIFVEEGGEALDNALSTSPSRRKLHDEGKYMTRSYMMAWGRQEQMAWAARNPGGAV